MDVQALVEREKMYQRRRRIAAQVGRELLGDIHEYFYLDDDKSSLDGWFTAGELRRIADAMNEVKTKLV